MRVRWIRVAGGGDHLTAKGAPTKGSCHFIDLEVRERTGTERVLTIEVEWGKASASWSLLTWSQQQNWERPQWRAA